MDWLRENHDWPNAHLSKFVDVQGTRLHVQRDGAGPRLLLLHGSGATTHSFDGLLNALSGRFELLVPDLPGHGFSSEIFRRNPNLNNISEVIAGLLQTEEFAPDLVVGHSAGAAILVNMLTRGLIDPTGIVSINGAFYPFPGFARQFFPAMAKLLFLNPFVPKFFAISASSYERVKRLIDSTGSQLSAKQINYYKRAFNNTDHVEGTLAMMANWDLEKMENQLKNLQIPLLQIIGQRDGTVSPKASLRTHNIVKNSIRQEVTGAGHLVHEEDPERVSSEIISFANQLGINTRS